MKRLWIGSLVACVVWTYLCHWFIVQDFHRTQQESRMFVDAQLLENHERLLGYMEILTSMHRGHPLPSFSTGGKLGVPSGKLER